MATKNFVPRADGEGKIGTTTKRWAEGHFDSLEVLGGAIGGDVVTQTPSSSFVVDWGSGQYQQVTITGTDLPITFTNPSGPCRLILLVIQGDGNDTIDWDNETDIQWQGGVSPILSTGSGEVDLVTFFFDGTTYYGVANFAFS